MLKNFQAVFTRRAATRAFYLLFLLVFPAISKGSLTAQEARVTLPESRANLPAGALDLGPSPASQPVTKIALHLRASSDAADLEQFLSGLNDPSSGSYHHWLTPSAFAARFGASDSQVAAAEAWAHAQGFSIGSVNAAHTVLVVSGTVAQAQRAFAAPMHQFQVEGEVRTANTEPASIAAEATDLIAGVDGLNDAGVASAATISASGKLETIDKADAASISALIDANAISVLVLHGVSADWKPLLQQANAQGITVLADTATMQPEATIIASAPLASALLPTETRPDWQNAAGLPADGLRALPDLVSSEDFSEVIARLMQKTGGRLGNINATLYRLAPIQGVFTQPDSAPAGTWEAETGLGVVNVEKLVSVWPAGSSPTNTSISSSNYAPTHGVSFTLTATVTPQVTGGATPTGTVTFTSSSTGTLGTITLDAAGKATYSTDQLAGGTYGFNATYNGDATYNVSNTPVPATVNVQAETASVSAILNGTAAYGSNATVVVSVTGASTVGYPTGTVKAQGQGTTDTTAYSATLAPSGTPGKSTATISYPVSERNTFTLLVSCTSGDNSFSCFTPYSLSVTPGATKTASTTTLSSTPNPPVAGSSATFNATVASGSASVTTVPTGSVSFLDNGAAIGSGTLSAGKASFTTTLASGAVHSITAEYTGDTVYNSSASAAISTGAGSTPSAVTLISSPNPPVLGSNTSFTATVASGAASSTATPTGTVAFKDNATTLSTVPVNGGVANYVGVLAAGAVHSVTAVYSGSTTYAASTSAPITLGAATGTTPTTTSITASSFSATAGTNITFTSTVKGSSGTTTPTGTVTLRSDKDGVIGTGTLGTDGTVNISNTMLSAGVHNITAAYGGDATYAASISVAATVTITPAKGPLTASLSPSPAVYGSKVTIYATVAVTAGAANGTFEATVNGKTYTGAITTGSGSIILDAPPPRSGGYPVVVSCPASTNFTCDNSVNLTLNVNRGPTAASVVSSLSLLPAGEKTTLTATLANTGNGSGPYTYSGTVTFLDGAQSLGSAPVVGNTASAPVTLTGGRTHSVTAVYSGDTNWLGSTSTAIPIVTTQLDTNVVLTTSSVNPLMGSNLVLTATVTSLTSTTLSPATGLVTFYDTIGSSVITLGSAALVANGPSASVALFSTTGFQAGAHRPYAVYVGDTNYKTSTSSTLLVTVADFGITFSPTALAVRQGGKGQASLTIGSTGGFSGNVSLACTPAPDTLMTCSLSPSVVSTGGTTVLTITTTANTATDKVAGWKIPVGGAVLAGLLFCLSPRRRRIRGLLLMLAVASFSFGVAGCGSGMSNVVVPGGTANNGTPFGVQLVTVTASSIEGATPIRHTYTLQVNVQ